MLATWIEAEMQDTDLGDKRLNRRLEQILSALNERPTASIPAACGGWKETVAAYRFFDNEAVTPEKVLESHLISTRRRMAEHKVVLLVQDTTEIDLTRPEQQVVRLMPDRWMPRHGGERFCIPWKPSPPTVYRWGAALGEPLDPPEARITHSHGVTKNESWRRQDAD